MNIHKCIWWYHYTCMKTLGLFKSVQMLFVLFYEKMRFDSVCKIVEIHMKFSTLFITKTCLYNVDPLKPHFYIVQLGFTGVYIIFLISAQNIDCG